MGVFIHPPLYRLLPGSYLPGLDLSEAVTDKCSLEFP
jgi:hypothetical protein